MLVPVFNKNTLSFCTSLTGNVKQKHITFMRNDNGIVSFVGLVIIILWILGGFSFYLNLLFTL